MSDQDIPNGQRMAASEPGGVETVASPLPYLFAEERHGDRQAREALFCTFNADLGFFERTVLGITQATGARVTVVGDARMSNPDPRAARNAGTRYVHGIAATPHGSAFHPKITVVVGPERALLAVGSGNLSVGGWHLNAETWTVTTANRDRCPALIPQAAAWLRALDQVCAISPPAVAGLRRVAEALDTFARASAVVDTGHQLVHTSIRPIIDSLPTGPVEQLLLYAPFHDEKAEAIRELVRRLRPAKVALAVQSGSRTVIEPGAIERVFEDLDVPLTVFEDIRKEYRHGKLIEAVSPDGSRWTLTGSPNLSASALLRSASDGGNIELGVVAEPSATLFPRGPQISLADVPAVSIVGSAAPRPTPGALLIAATRTPHGLSVAFARPTEFAIRILASRQTDFDTWSVVGPVSVGSAEHLFTGVDLPGGSRVQAVWDDDAGVHYGTLVFVTDPERVMTRAGEEDTRSATSQGPVELLADSRLVDMWLAGLRQLAAARKAVALPRAAGTGAPHGEGDQHGGGPRIDTDAEDWLVYSDDARARLGTNMFRFALGGFPALHARDDTWDTDLAMPTDRLVDERAAALDGDDANTVNDDVDPLANDAADTGSENRPSDGGTAADSAGAGNDAANEMPERDKRRNRRQLTRTVREEIADLPAVHRLAVGTLVLVAIELGVWETAAGEEGWIAVLAAAVAALDLGDVPAEMEANTASFAAVAIYLIRDHLPLTGRTHEVLCYDEAADRTAHLYPAAEPTLMANYAGPIHNSRGFPVDPDEVMRTIAMIVQDDPLADAADVLTARHPNWQVHKHSGAVLHVHGPFRAPLNAAAEALDSIAHADVAAAWATSSHGGWALAARDGSDMIHVEHRHNSTMWRHYRLTPLTNATRIAQDRELAGRLRVAHGRLSDPFREALAILSTAGVDVSDGPPKCF